MMKRYALRAGVTAGALAVALDIALSGLAQAAGFDCSKASSAVEKMICANPSLVTRDDTLTRLYGWLLEEANPYVKPKLVADQKIWITQRDACTTSDCLNDAYGARIAQLAAIKTDGGASATYVAEAADVARVTEQIRKDLRENGFTGAVGQCSHILSLDSHPKSYGAVCSLGSKRSVEVCSEDMFGNLAVSFSFEVTGRSLATFTQVACPGG